MNDEPVTEYSTIYTNFFIVSPSTLCNVILIVLHVHIKTINLISSFNNKYSLLIHIMRNDQQQLPKKFTFNRAIFIDRDLKRINIDRNFELFLKQTFFKFYVKIHIAS